MRRKLIIRLVIVMWMASMLIGGQLSVSAQGNTPEDLRFFLTFVPNIQFAPVYVADAKGYLEESGYAFAIEHGDEHVGVDLIATDTIQFGVISGEQVIMARASGRPVVYIYEWFQQYPVGIVIPDTVDVESVTDLAGLKVGIPGRFGASYSGLTALLAANNMRERDIQLEPIGFTAPDILCAGGVDASVVYVNNEPIQIQQRADEGNCGVSAEAPDGDRGGRMGCIERPAAGWLHVLR